MALLQTLRLTLIAELKNATKILLRLGSPSDPFYRSIKGRNQLTGTLQITKIICDEPLNKMTGMGEKEREILF